MLEADIRQHLHTGVDHVGRVVAAAQARLDDRHLDITARELSVRRGSERLELRDAVPLRERAIHEHRRLSGTLDRRREPRLRHRDAIDLDPFRERPEMG